MLNDDKSTQFNLNEYENQSLNDRMCGKNIDRNAVNLLQIGKLFDRKKFVQYGTELSYSVNRSLNPRFVKRLINEDIVNLQQIHKRMISLLAPILLDIFSSKPPTVYDWIHSNSSDQINEEAQENIIHDRQTRRVREDFPNVITNLDKTFSFSSCNETDKKSFCQREMLDGHFKKSNKSIKKITTSYSREPINPQFDSSIFIDKNYVKRATKFWKNTMYVLNNILNNTRVKPEKEWLLFHIVNNDIGFHVLFDNLSAQCEIKRLDTLSLQTRRKYFLPDFVCYVKPLTDDDIRSAIWEWKIFVEEFMKMDYALLNNYKIKPLSIKKHVCEMILESTESYSKGDDHETSNRILKIFDEFYKNW